MFALLGHEGENHNLGTVIWLVRNTRCEHFFHERFELVSQVIETGYRGLSHSILSRTPRFLRFAHRYAFLLTRAAYSANAKLDFPVPEPVSAMVLPVKSSRSMMPRTRGRFGTKTPDHITKARLLEEIAALLHEEE